jgi:hypothetical protein
MQRAHSPIRGELSSFDHTGKKHSATAAPVATRVSGHAQNKINADLTLDALDAMLSLHRTLSFEDSDT